MNFARFLALLWDAVGLKMVCVWPTQRFAVARRRKVNVLFLTEGW